YTRLGYSYSLISPFLALEYSSDGGLFLGARIKSTAQGFRNRPHTLFQYLSVTRALNSNSYHIKYKGDYANLFRNTNLAITGDAQLPTARTRFYGIGNNTVNAPSGADDHSFYLARYNLSTLSFSLRNSVNQWLTLKAGPIVQYFSLSANKNTGKFITTINPSLPHIAPYGSQFYVGGEGGLEVNTRNDKLFPTRGVSFNAAAQYYGSLNRQIQGYSQLGAAFSFYTDLLAKNRLVFASAIGGGHTIGDYQFYQAQHLGFKQNLRGYRIQRFAGRTRAYNNTELRWKIGEANLYLLRGPFGLLGFHDTGRVWADGEKSDTWHTSSGGGVWIAPFNKALIAVSFCHSKEERNLMLLSFGFQF
ncbi:MAG: hypothetical protein JWP88_877, partial [Flaviaesturariibacter sp.]|nr:hypothetical protein [Flaviaesturariibacter sp.]